MIWIILISLVLIFLMWLLFVPVIIYTDTDRNRYYLTLPGILKAVVISEKGLFYIRGWFFFIPFRFDPFKRKSKKEKRKPRKKKKRRKWKSANLGYMQGALRAFRIRRLEANIDTDDFSLNAWLVPVFSAVNRDNIRLQVNFEGYQFLLLDLRVTLGVLIYSFLKIKYKSIINR
jgi:hypothetical protein